MDDRIVEFLGLRVCEATNGNALILEALDPEAGRYRIELEAASVRDESVSRHRGR